MYYKHIILIERKKKAELLMTQITIVRLLIYVFIYISHRELVLLDSFVIAPPHILLNVFVRIVSRGSYSY